MKLLFLGKVLLCCLQTSLPSEERQKVCICAVSSDVIHPPFTPTCSFPLNWKEFKEVNLLRLILPTPPLPCVTDVSEAKKNALRASLREKVLTKFLAEGRT